MSYDMERAGHPALIAEQQDGRTILRDAEIAVGDLPEGEVVVRVTHSSLNYKDALAVTGRGKVIRRFPMVPGIDLAGRVESSASAAFRPGDPVIATGCGLGEDHWGGYAGLARVRAGWLVPLPDGLTLEQSMAIGTAGFTAMLAVMALEHHGVRPDQGPVLVTGGGGGLAGLAIALLSAAGYQVTASTGRPALREYLESLGAGAVLERSALDRSAKPLESETWAAAVDSVGGATLGTVVAQLRRHGAVAVCGLAGGPQLSTTVFPLILRGVSLLGIDSVWCPPERRLRAWQRLGRDLPKDRLDRMVSGIDLSAVKEHAEALLDGRIRGRVVVRTS